MLARILTRGKPLLSLPFLLALVAACGGTRLDIEYDYDGDADFASLRTWSWMAMQGSETGSDVVDRIVREELASELARRGYRHVAAGGDFRAGFVLETDRKMTERLVYNRYGYVYDDFPFDGAGSIDVVVDDYVQGTLIVDVAAADGKRPIWRGWAEGVLREKPTEAEVRKRAKEAIRRVLAKFPPPATRKKG